MYEVTVSRIFAAAHAIRLTDGSTEPIHGHNWSVEVTVTSDRLDEMEVVMDFHELEAAVDRLITKVHNRNLNDVAPFVGGKTNPTAERVAWWIGHEVAKGLPADIRLHSVKIGEAPGCTATFRPQPQKKR